MPPLPHYLTMKRGTQAHGHLVTKLGYLTIEPAVYDEEGNETTAAVVSDVYAVDVYWSGDAFRIVGRLYSLAYADGDTFVWFIIIA